MYQYQVSGKEEKGDGGNKYSESQTWELRPPKGLGKSDLNSQVVSIATFGSM